MCVYIDTYIYIYIYKQISHFMHIFKMHLIQFNSMFKLAVNRLWIGEYSRISAVALKELWLCRSGSLAEVSQKQRISFKVLMGTVTGWGWGKVCVLSVGFVVCIAVLISITFLKDSSLIFRESSSCEFNSKLGNQALIPLQRRKNLINSLNINLH